MVFRGRIRPLLSFWKQELTFLLPIYNKPLNAVARYFKAENYQSSLAMVSSIRNWVNSNSIHLIDDEHDSYAFHVPTAVRKAHHFWLSGKDRPHLSCGPRSYVMKEILNRLDIQSRVIDLFFIDENCVPDSHTLLEVFDCDTQRWHLEDPDFNVRYIDKISGEPISLYWAFGNPSQIGYECDIGDIENIINLKGTVEDFFVLAA